MFDATRGAAFPAVLDPMDFFLGRTEGCAMVRAVTGRPLRRCTILTQGADSAEFGAMHFDEIYTYDDGGQDQMRWAVTRDDRGRLQATEESVTAPITSTLKGPEWRVRFRRRAKPPASGPVLILDARFNLVRPDVVMKTVTVSMLGVPLAVLSGFHRKV